MQDMLSVLRRAKQKPTFKDPNEFKSLLEQIKKAKPTLKIDWDEGAGEKWVRFIDQNNGIVCMLSVDLKLAFIRENSKIQSLLNTMRNYEIVFVDDFSSDNWSIDVDELENDIAEIVWHTSEDVINSNCFSLDDFYFATI